MALGFRVRKHAKKWVILQTPATPLGKSAHIMDQNLFGKHMTTNDYALLL